MFITQHCHQHPTTIERSATMSSPQYSNDRQQQAMLYIQSYRTSLALNNNGVALLERSRFEEAAKVLHDSVDVMLSVCRFGESGCSPSHNSVIYSKADLDKKLSRATRYLSSLRGQSSPSTMGLGDTLSDDVDSLFLRSGCSSSLSQFLPSTSVYPIWIETYCEEQKRSDFERRIDAAIVMHNYGLALFCIAKTALLRNKPEKASKYHYQVSKLLQCSRDLLTEPSSRGGDSDYFDDENDHLFSISNPKQYLFLRLVVLNSVIQLCKALNMTSEDIRQHLEEACDIKLVLQQIVWTEAYRSTAFSAAKAA